MFVGVLYLCLAGEVPITNWGKHLNLRVEGRCADLYTHLVLTFAGAPMSHSNCSFFVGDVHEGLGDQRTGQRGDQRVSSLIHSISLEGRVHVVLGEGLLEVEDIRFHRTAV